MEFTMTSKNFQFFLLTLYHREVSDIVCGFHLIVLRKRIELRLISDGWVGYMIVGGG